MKHQDILQDETEIQFFCHKRHLSLRIPFKDQSCTAELFPKQNSFKH